MFRFALSLQGRELFAIELGSPEPPAAAPIGNGLMPNGAPEVEISRHGGDFTLGFGPPPPNVEPTPSVWSLTNDVPPSGRNTKEKAP